MYVWIEKNKWRKHKTTSTSPVLCGLWKPCVPAGGGLVGTGDGWSGSAPGRVRAESGFWLAAASGRQAPS